jgi:DMSO/TMAO reductase YedYZ molybdopterin-dependent catalytic subunit
VPPGQHETTEFPVLSIGPTPLIDMQNWRLVVTVRGEERLCLDWSAFNDLASSSWNGDIHCVTRWSKFDTSWRGISIDTILEAAGIAMPPAYLLAVSKDGYSTNLPTSDVIGGKALVATHFEDEALGRHHGGPARLFVPHLYFWKSAKWLCELHFNDEETPGFWETRGYHIYGDPWHEQRFDGE